MQLHCGSCYDDAIKKQAKKCICANSESVKLKEWGLSKRQLDVCHLCNIPQALRFPIKYYIVWKTEPVCLLRRVEEAQKD